MRKLEHASFRTHLPFAIHAHACCGAQRAINVEYFYGHARIDKMAFDDMLEIKDGLLRPDLTRPGFGIAFKESDMRHYRV